MTWQHIDKTGPVPVIDHETVPAMLTPGEWIIRPPQKPRANCIGCGAPPSGDKCDHCGRWR